MGAREYDSKREQANEAHRQARELRELHLISNCGLDIRINYGNKYVPRHIALRISDQFPIWADEYDAAADRLEEQMAGMFAEVTDHE